MKRRLTAWLCLLTAALSAAQPFELKLSPGRTDYTVSAPESGCYWVESDSALLVPVGLEHSVRLKWDDGLPLRRMLLKAMETRCKRPLDRVTLTAGTPRKLHIEYDAKSVRLPRLVFRPQQPVKVPKAAALYQPPAVPPAAHPRILVTPELLPKIRAGLAKHENARVWQILCRLAREPYKLKIAPDREYTFDGQAVLRMRQKAFYFLMTGDRTTGLDAVRLAREYLDKVSFGNRQDICRQTGESIYSAAVVYDWCYPLLTAEDRRVLHDRMLFFAAEMECGWPPFRQSAAFGHGNEAQMSRDLLSMAIAFYTEDPEPFRYLAYQIWENLRPLRSFVYASGRHDQGTNYGLYRSPSDFFAALTFRRTLGLELFPESVKQYPYSWYYMRKPDGRFLSEGDTHGSWRMGYEPFRLPDLNTLYAFLALYPDPELKMESLRCNPLRLYPDPAFYLAVNDPELRPQGLRKRLPLTRLFSAPVPGLYVRTGWNFGIASDDALVAMLGAHTWFRGHHHLDMGSFQITYRGDLVSDLGQYHIYGVPYDINLAKSSALHSLMRFVDPAQKKWNFHRNAFVNTGGIDLYGRGEPLPFDKLFHTETFRSGSTPRAGFGPDRTRPRWNFMEVDLSRAYTPRVRDYTRSFVFWNQESPERPGTLLILDRFATARPEIRPVFQLTTIQKPEWKDGKLVIRASEYGRVGQLTLTPLLPAKGVSANILTGKDAHTFEGKFIPPPIASDPEADGSRVELSGPGSVFLNALQLHDGALNAFPVSVQEQAGRLYAELSAEPVSYLAGFGDVRKPTSQSFTFTVARDNTEILLLDLAPGAWQITGGETIFTRQVTPEQGCLALKLNRGEWRCSPAPDITAPGITGAPVRYPASPRRETVYVNGKPVPGVKVTEEKSELLLSLVPFGKCSGETLTLNRKGVSVTLTAGSREVRSGSVTLHLDRTPGPDFRLSATEAGMLLGMAAETDRENRAVFFHDTPEAAAFLWIRGTRNTDQIRRLILKHRGWWGTEGREHMLEIILAEECTLAGMEVHLPLGERRKAYLQLDLSADGKAFHTAYDGAASGKAVLETIRFAPRKARVIRLYTKGNNENDRNTTGRIRLLPFR